MQKLLLSAVGLLVATLAIPALARFTVSLGAQSTQMDIESEADRYLSFPVEDKGTVTLDLKDAENNQDTDWGGELAVGYQYDFNPTLNIALEAFGQLVTTKVDAPVYSSHTDFLLAEGHVPVYDATASFNWIAGLRLRPGYYVTPSTRLFIDGGIVWGDFELKQDDVVMDFWNSLPYADFDETERETLVGWRYGAGVEHEVTDDFAIGIDFIITEFETFESDSVEDVSKLFSSLAGPNVTTAAQSTYTPTLTMIGLNFKYLLGGK